MRVLVLTILLSVTGCAAASPAPTIAPGTNSFCLLAEPITPTAAEWQLLSDATARQIERHDIAGERLCGWSS